MAAVATDDAALVAAFRERSRLESTRYHIARFVRRKPLGAFGATVLILLIVTALLADVIAPCGDTEQGVGPPRADLSLDHLVGTDQFGRDLFTRLVFGARISLQVAVGATVFSIVPATMPGMTSAFFRGTFDYVAQRFVDAVQAVPALILLIAIVVILGAGVLNVVLALSIRSAIVNSRVMRGATLQVANRNYVTAAGALGASPARILMRHIRPHIAAPMIIVASLGFGQFILAEAALSFLGYGVPAPAPSWGGMLSGDGRSYMYSAPHMFVGPAVALSLVVFGVNMFGDALRDVLDPRLRGAGTNN